METNQLRDEAFARSGSEERPRAIIAIGASAGGLEALRDMLASARMPTNLAFVVIQHLDPTHESMLAQLLDRATSLDVLQCEGGERLHADRVYIIPPGRGLAIEGDTLQLTDFKKPRGLRRPIDDFLPLWLQIVRQVRHASSSPERGRTDPQVCVSSRNTAASLSHRHPTRQNMTACPPRRSRPVWSTSSNRRLKSSLV